jgi:hypothetical protein
VGFQVFLKEIDEDVVTPDHIYNQLAEDWLAWLNKQGKGARSINIALQMVHVAVRRWAKLLRLQDPLAGVDKVAETPRTRGELSIDELRKLLGPSRKWSITGPRHYIMG